MLDVTRAEYDLIASLSDDDKETELRRIMAERAPEYMAKLDADLAAEAANRPGNFRGTRLILRIRDAGDYEKRIDANGVELYSGVCMQCAERVDEGEPFAVLYHPTSRGGIFHTRCAPTGGDWYGLEDE